MVDPRTYVTPDAFKISPEVLGLPLASPKRRLAAFAVDGMLIGIVSQLNWRILGVIAAIAFFRAATRRSSPGRVGVAFQYSAGCLGALILFVTVLAGTEMVRSLLVPEPDEIAETSAGTLRGVLGGVDAFLRLADVESEDEAVEVGLQLVQSAEAVSDAAPEELLELVRENLPADRDIDADVVVARIAAEQGVEVADESAAEADSLSADAAWAGFSRLNALDSLTAEDTAERERLRTRLTQLVSADTLAALERLLARSETETEDLEDALRRTRQDLETEREGSGLFSWFVKTVDELGLTFGWGALYLATFTTLMKGQTPAKKMFGIRVLRLDGLPMGWYHAFERAGGYAAGVATGLLGFFEVLWDPNRQGIHDKVVATVVVREGAPRAPVTKSSVTVRSAPPSAKA